MTPTRRALRAAALPAAKFRRLFESHLHVRDLQRSMDFYGDVLGLELGLHEVERRAAFYWIGGRGTSMLGLWEQPPWTGAIQTAIVPHHIAFEVASRDLAAAIRRLQQRGIETRNFDDEVTSLPSAFPWIPALSIYFNDPDGHLLELIAKTTRTKRGQRRKRARS